MGHVKHFFFGLFGTEKYKGTKCSHNISVGTIYLPHYLLLKMWHHYHSQCGNQFLGICRKESAAPDSDHEVGESQN